MDVKVNGIVDDKDIIINILVQQRNSLMDQVTGLQLQVQKMVPFMPKDPEKKDDDQRQ